MQSAVILLTKIQMGWMTRNKLSIIDGLITETCLLVSIKIKAKTNLWESNYKLQNFEHFFQT